MQRRSRSCLLMVKLLVPCQEKVKSLNSLPSFAPEYADKSTAVVEIAQVYFI